MFSTRLIERWVVCAGIAVALLPRSLWAGPSRVLDRAAYQDRLRAMWLGECIANWTGLRTEGAKQSAPFFTDADWGTLPPGWSNPIVYVTWGNPWGADDDTDLEYVYLALLTQHSATVLTPAQIYGGWLAHINGNIWVSNAAARALMGRGVVPPVTGMFTPNTSALMIDAQLTTEMFGAFAPGSPVHALAMAELPIRTTASGYAADAARFYTVLYALAAVVDPNLSPREQSIWLVTEARRYLPDSSKSADIVDFVLADYLANPDVDDWELTRDRVAARYQSNAAANGFIYRAWYESSVNFASGVIALLYGEMDYKKTIRIGTLSGWDSDNGTATMGGLIGLVIGTQALRDQFPAVTRYDRYWAWRTRPSMIDYLPSDPQAEDTFSLMAARMGPIVDRAIVEAGGKVDEAGGRYLLPPAPNGAVLSLTPAQREASRSANLGVRAVGGAVTATSSVNSSPWSGGGAYGLADPAIFANGTENDVSGIEETPSRRGFYSTQNGGVPAGGSVTMSVLYDRPVELHTVRFIEGEHFNFPGLVGGWFGSITIQARVAGAWVDVSAVPSEPLDDARPFQMIDFVLDSPVQASGVRIVGVTGGPQGVATLTELDALSAPLAPSPLGVDLDASGGADVDDLYYWEGMRTDMDGDGSADEADSRYLQTYLRWNEPLDITPP